MDTGFIGIIGSYLIGSIPFGLLYSKLTGAPDPREEGSQNIGFTNVLRVCGKSAGAFTLLGDMGKGFMVTALGKYFDFSWRWILFFGLAVIIGHIFSIFLSFKGGKGVATALGAIGGLHGFIGLTLIGVWLFSVYIFKYSSGGALIAFGVLPLCVIVFDGGRDFLIFSFVVTAVIFYCHKENILRLYHGVEPKIGSASS